MKSRPSHIIGLVAAIGAALSDPQGYLGKRFKKIRGFKSPHNPHPANPSPCRTTLFRGQSQRDKDRLAKRAERDLRACRMNYAGWCGYEESGTL